MCDASNLAVGAVLGQKIDRKSHVIFYASKMLNQAQRNYDTTEKEMLAVVYSFEKFRPYLLGSRVIVYTDHATIKYLFEKRESKLTITQGEEEEEIPDAFPEEHLYLTTMRSQLFSWAHHVAQLDPAESSQGAMKKNIEPWFADLANYLVTGELPLSTEVYTRLGARRQLQEVPTDQGNFEAR
ncbi:hypothetical protein AAHA92_07095 [Salvia divinorum]|uniref:Reverse transcriptase RNase H-like domain-containing protein n=1 Tax=Salvia divinorum TaxID=28513 RepID=A0ABD1I8U3_SALDI